MGKKFEKKINAIVRDSKMFNRCFVMRTTGPKQEGKSAMEYVLKLYMAANPDPDRSCYSHFTTATGVFDFISIKMKNYRIVTLNPECVLPDLKLPIRMIYFVIISFIVIVINPLVKQSVPLPMPYYIRCEQDLS